MLKERHRIFVSLLVALDTLVALGAIAVALAAAAANRSGSVVIGEPPLDMWTVFPFIAALPVLLLCMVGANLYRPRRDSTFLSEFLDLLRAVVFAWVILTLTLLFIRRQILDRLLDQNVLELYLCFTLAMLTAHRFLFRALLRRMRTRGWNQRHVAIIGAGRLGQVALRTFMRNSWTGINGAYFISHHEERPSFGSNPPVCLGRPVLGGLTDLEDLLERHPVDGVIIALPQSRTHRLPNILSRLERFAVEVRIIPDISPKYMPMNLAVAELDGLAVLTVRQSPLVGYGALTKRIVDILLAALAMLFFGAPMAVIALLIRLESPGPVFFRQSRAGMGGRPFTIYKFRTMYLNVPVDDAAIPRGRHAWTHRDDPRITRVGRFLRKMSLDELPQLINVLKGDMSLVGPRPERVDLLHHFRDDTRGYMLRSNVKAGMTGWAQVNGLRGDTSLRKRLQYDLYYVRNWSLLFDLRILWLTLFRGFRHPNAH